MKNSIVLKRFLFQCDLMSLFRSISRLEKVSILRYHSVADPEDNYYTNPSISLVPDVFEKQVQYITKHYNVITLNDVYMYLVQERNIPKNTVVFTFDDGYADNYIAYLILKKYNATGTFYITARCIEHEPLWLFEVNYLISATSKHVLEISTRDERYDFQIRTKDEKRSAIRKIMELVKSHDLATREDIRRQLKDQIQDVHDLQEKSSRVMLSWNQIREMNDNGMTIGSHTLTHLNLPNADFADAKTEILESKKLLEEKIHCEVVHFSYPNGGNYDYYNTSIKEFVKQAGYKTATTSNNGVISPLDDCYELNRIRVTQYLPEILYQIDCEPFISNILKRGVVN